MPKDEMEEREGFYFKDQPGSIYMSSQGPGNYRPDVFPLRFESKASNPLGRMQEGGDPGLESGSEAGSKKNYETGSEITEQAKTYFRRQGGSSMEGTDNIGGGDMEVNSPEGQVQGGMTSQQEMGTTGPSGNMQVTGAEGSRMEEGGKGSMENRESSSRGFGGAAGLQEYLRGVDYPAMKQDMMDAARSNSAPQDIMSMMDKLPDKTYNSPADVEEEFRKIA